MQPNKLTPVDFVGLAPVLLIEFYYVYIFRGEVINGGFGLVLDGSTEAEERAKMMLSWDVSNGVSKTH